MGALFRSEDMTLLRLYFERSAAHDTVDELGNLSLVQFVDLNASASAFQRSFSANVRACDEMQRRLRFLHTQIAKEPDVGGGALEAIADVDRGDERFAATREALRLDDLDVELGKIEGRVLAMNENYSGLVSQRNALVELHAVLCEGGGFFSSEARSGGGSESSYGSLGVLAAGEPGNVGGGLYGGSSGGGGRGLLSGGGLLGGGGSGLLSNVAGVVESDKVATLQRVVYRATRGNCHARFKEISEPISDPAGGEPVRKSVFMLFFSGSIVREKVKKICSAFDANVYTFPEGIEEQNAALQEVEGRLRDLEVVIAATSSSRKASLVEVADRMAVWTDKVVREKAIYHTLNMLNFDTSNALFIAEVWIPSYALGDVNAALNVGRRRSHAQVPSVIETRPLTKELTPPTYFKVNKFTQVFQDIVESYGVAEYHEVNPAPFSVITFPFLFAVMFGDIGHGFVMAAFAGWVCVNEARMNRRKLGEFMKTVYDGRYMLVLMGLFSIYTGALYNEFFAVPLDLFGSRYKFTAESTMACGIDACEVASAVNNPIHPYPFGFDPIWKSSMTGLVFFNSYKMKLSIVLGVCQMVMGICMSYKNAVFHRKPLDIWYVFIPQMIFMNAIFGYLVIIILLKWSINWDSVACRADPNCIAPDLKQVLIDMFMSPGTVSPVGQLYPGQAFVQVFLLVAALVAIPWMLFPKPLILRARFEKKAKAAYRPLVDDGESSELLPFNGNSGTQNSDDVTAVAAEGGVSLGEDDDVDDDFNFGEMFVNQMIHTIEFVLGAVSNTASYLRLWALSLAHVQLADVFLEKLLYMTIETGSSILIIMGFFMWVALTVGVLLFMESLSAFLHALRLHWVEFQNKFYNLHGDGKKFMPFNFEFEIDDEYTGAAAK